MNNQRKRKSNNSAKYVICAAVILVIAVILLLIFLPDGKDKEKEASPFATAESKTSQEAEKEKQPSANRGGAIYYNSLKYSEQLVYDAILDAATSVSDKTETVECDLSIDRFEDITSFVRAEHPELFYIDFDALVLEVSKKDCYVDMKYCVDTALIADMKAELDSVLTAITTDDGFLLADDDFEKELFLHDLIVANCDVAEGVDPLYNTAYGALVMNQAYCDGYAYAMKLMLNKAGIEAYIAYGTAGEADHAWNVVCIGGEYFHLDSMWDDANLSIPVDMAFHGYFNLSDKVIGRDHKMTYPELLPDADSENDYYSETGKKAKTLAGMDEIFDREIASAVSDGHEYIEAFCDESADEEALKEILIPCINASNEEHGDVLLDFCQVYSASEISNAVTIQIFYTE